MAPPGFHGWVTMTGADDSIPKQVTKIDGVKEFAT
jgi:hypothetical protein